MYQEPAGESLTRWGVLAETSLKVCEGQLEPHLVGDGDEVQHRVGGAAQGRVEHQGVRQAGAGEEAAGGPAPAHHFDRLGAGAPGQRQTRRERRRDGGVAGQAPAPGTRSDSSWSWP